MGTVHIGFSVNTYSPYKTLKDEALKFVDYLISLNSDGPFLFTSTRSVLDGDPDSIHKD